MRIIEIFGEVISECSMGPNEMLLAVIGFSCLSWQAHSSKAASEGKCPATLSSDGAKHRMDKATLLLCFDGDVPGSRSLSRWCPVPT